MKSNIGLNSFLANIPSIVCVVAGVAMAIKGIDGWGWFLFGALFLSRTVEVGKDESKSND